MPLDSPVFFGILDTDMRTKAAAISMRYSMLLILVSWAVGWLVGCNGEDIAKNSEPGLVDSAIRPDSEVAGARILLYDRGQVTSEILADKIYKFEARDSTVGHKLDIVFYDSLGEVNSTVVGDSGIIRETRGLLDIYGNVVVVDENESRLETDYLFWNQTTRKMRTDAFVRITYTDGSVVTGWGLEADRNLSTYKILNQVSGTVKDTRKKRP